MLTHTYIYCTRYLYNKCSGVLVVRENMRSSECFLLVGDRKGI